MTQAFVPAARRPPLPVAGPDITVAPPPDLPSPATGLLTRLLPVITSVAAVGVMAVVFFTRSGSGRNPAFLALPVMMIVSTLLAVLTGRGQHPGRRIRAERVAYFRMLNRVRDEASETAAAQRSSLIWSHPEPDTLWTLIGGTRMWERRAGDTDFCVVRVGTGAQPLARRLVAPDGLDAERCDPVTVMAMRRFIRTHSTIDQVPVAVDLRDRNSVAIEGGLSEVRGLLRAMICQLAVFHAPDQVLIAGLVGEGNQAHWEWLKWLPHNQHPTAADFVGSARMIYRSPAELRSALADLGPKQLVVIADQDGGIEADLFVTIPQMTVIEVRLGREGSPPMLRYADHTRALFCPDDLAPMDALICGRRLAAYRVDAAVSHLNSDRAWPGLVGIDDVAEFDPITSWDNHYERLLRIPIGTTTDGVPLELDIKEAAQGGVGPHGLCVGATGSGKSELLRTVALGMMVRNSPEVLNLLLIDFKGGATFLDLAEAPHVAAIITNLAEEAPLVARMRDALAGEMNRRQQLLRAAGCGSIASYDHARRTGTRLVALPALFVVVDEFSELLSQHPDFTDTFVAIGRLGRSLGMHLLLASQRLDEGRLRGLEAHLSYRMCLKTLSAGESRIALGTADAYQLPNTPGAGFLRSGSDEPVRFQAAFVSAPTAASDADHATVPAPTDDVRPFTLAASGPVIRAPVTARAHARRTVLQTVVRRLAGLGPPARRVWLPPLGPAPSLDSLLADVGTAATSLIVPVGVVDRPFEQCRTPLTIDLSGAAGNLAVVGAPQSGKSTALRTVITALAATHDPSQVQFYCLDFGGGALSSVRTLPHVGAVASRAEQQLVTRIIAELESVVQTREAIYAERGVDSMAQYRRQREARDSDPFGDVFLVVDGWGTLRHEFGGLEEPVTALAAQGLSFGVHVVLSASRWPDIRPSLKDQIGTRIELRLGDPADSEFDRKRAHDVPLGRPGRGLSRDGLHMVIARPIDGDERWCNHSGFAAPPIPLLPVQVELDAIVQQAGPWRGTQILLGVDEHRLRPVAIDFERDSHLLILGDTECGKTATLRTVCHEITRTKTVAEARLFVVDFRRSLLGVIESEHLGGYAVSPAALDVLLPDLLALLRRRMPPADASQAQLRTGSWWSGPDIYVVVDDYDLVVTATGNPLAHIIEYLPYARDLGLHVVIARRSGGAARALFEPLLAGLRDLGCLGLMMSGRPDEGVLLGSSRPARLPPGRGLLVTRTGAERLVQVGWCPAP